MYHKEQPGTCQGYRTKDLLSLLQKRLDGGLPCETSDLMIEAMVDLAREYRLSPEARATS